MIPHRYGSNRDPLELLMSDSFLTKKIDHADISSGGEQWLFCADWI